MEEIWRSGDMYEIARAFEEPAIGAILMDVEYGWKEKEDGVYFDAIDIGIEMGVMPEHFMIESHKRMWGAILDMASKKETINTNTLNVALGKIDEELYASVPIGAVAQDAGTVRKFYEGIRRAAFGRLMVSKAEKLARLAYEWHEIPQAMERAWAIMGELDEGARIGDITGMKPIRDVMGRVVKRIVIANERGVPAGLMTGFVRLDKMLGGLQKGDVAVVAARPGMGKTAFVTTVGVNVAKQGNRVAYFFLEMQDEQIGERMLSMESSIDSSRLRRGDVRDDEWDDLYASAQTLSNLDIVMDDQPAISVVELRRKARAEHKKKPLHLLIVDYIGLMTADGIENMGNEYAEITYISKALKALAAELNIPIIVLSQLSRKVEDRQDKRPMLSDLRSSGAIEQDAAVVMFIYRDEYYDEDSERKGIADVIVAKHRHGEVGTVGLFFRKELTQFRDLEIRRTDLEDGTVETFQ